jgi:hypothetical protein
VRHLHRRFRSDADFLVGLGARLVTGDVDRISTRRRRSGFHSIVMPGLMRKLLRSSAGIVTRPVLLMNVG